MIRDDDLYERDFVAWTKDQAAHIKAAAKARLNLLIDWERVAEEIEDLGKSTERELQSRLTTIIEHLLRLRHSLAEDPRAGGLDMVLRERIRVEALIEQSPSLRPKLTRLLPRAHRDAAKIVKAALEVRQESGPVALRALDAQELTPDQVLGDWLPEMRRASSDIQS